MVAFCDSTSRFTEPVAELSLFLPSQQAIALERQAYAQGLTVAELLRHLIRTHLQQNAAVAATGRPG